MNMKRKKQYFCPDLQESAHDEQGLKIQGSPDSTTIQYFEF